MLIQTFKKARLKKSDLIYEYDRQIQPIIKNANAKRKRVLKTGSHKGTNVILQ